MTVRSAKMRRLNRGDYKVMCGAHPCTAVLGIASRSNGAAMTVADAVVWATREAADDPARSAWTLYADSPYSGYYRDGDTYRLIGAGRTRGRRPVPSGLASGGEEIARSRRVIGQYPSLPATIICPDCNRLNLVTVPQGE